MKYIAESNFEMMYLRISKKKKKKDSVKINSL